MPSVSAYRLVGEGYGPDHPGGESSQRGVDGSVWSEEAMTESEKERIARLETKLEHLTESLETMSGKVDELVNLLNQAKGAKWAILGVAGLAGFFGSKAGTWLWSSLPK